MQAQTAIERTESRRQGLIVAVSLSGERGVPKHPQSAVRVGQYGLEGDCHAGPRYTNVRTGEEKDNRRHVTVVAQEVLDEMNSVLGIALRPGQYRSRFSVHEQLGNRASRQPIGVFGNDCHHVGGLPVYGDFPGPRQSGAARLAGY